MNKRRKFILTISVIGIIVALVLSSCGSEQKKSADTAREDIYRYIPEDRKEKYGHISKEDMFDSEISVGYKNQDGSYTAYLFASPIRYTEGKELKDIDNKLIPNTEKNKETYKYRNKANRIQTFFPQELSSEKGFLVQDYLYDFQFGLMGENYFIEKQGEEIDCLGHGYNTLIYQGDQTELICGATKFGVKTQIILSEEKKIRFWLEAPGLEARITSDRYITLMDGDDLKSIIHCPSVFSKNTGELFLGSSFSLEKQGGRYILTVSLDERSKSQYPLSVETSFEMYVPTLPDSAVYSERPRKNQYLSEYGVVGNYPSFGDGQIFSRLRVHQYIQSKRSNVLSANIAFFEYSRTQSHPMAVSIHEVDQFWSSSNINWITKSPYGSCIETQDVEGSGYYYFDISEVIRNSLEDDSLDIETFGVLLRAEEDECQGTYKIFASSDNADFSPFLEICFKEKPEKFYITKN